MIGRLLRFDRAFDKIWGSWIVAVSFGIGLKYLSTRHPDFASIPMTRQPPAFNIVFVTMMLLFMFILISTNINNRCSRVSLIIPVSTRDLWIARMISIVFTASLPILIIMLILAVRSGENGPYIEMAVIWLGLRCVSAVVAAAMLFQSWKVELYRIPLTRAYMTFLTIGSIAVSGVTFVALTWPYLLYVNLGIALLLGIRIYRLLPASFRVAPFMADGAPAYGPQLVSGNGALNGRTDSPARSNGTTPLGASSVTGSGIDGEMAFSNGAARLGETVQAGRITSKTFFILSRSLLNNWKVWVYSILIVFYTFMIMLTYADGASRDNPYGIFLYTWIWMVIIEVLMRMYKLEYLPLSRKAFFGFAWGVVIVSMLAGATIGGLLTSINSRNFRQIRFYRNELHIPSEFFEISTDGPPQPVASPWGETYTPRSYPLYGGSDIHIYNPYEWGEDSSARFTVLQLDRAMEAVHEVEYDRRSMYETIDEDKEKLIESCCYSVNENDNSSVPRERAFAVAMSFAAIFYCGIFFLSLKAYAALRFKTLLAWVFPGSLILIMLIVVTVIIMGMMGLTSARAISAVPAILMRKTAESIPLGRAGLWSVFAFILVLGTLLVYEGFRRSEAIKSLGKSILKDY